MSRQDPVDLFLENAAKAAVGTHRAGGTEDLVRILREIVPSGVPVYCPGVSEAEQAAAEVLPDLTPEYAAAAVTVEEVHGAIAETGTLVCSSSGGRAVQASLLPSHHVAIVSPGNIFPTLEDFFASVAKGPPTNITLVTGPSRTADIELVLAIGVHGPGRLDIIVVP